MDVVPSSPRSWNLLAGVALAWLVAGCGGEPTTATLQRLQLQVVPGSPPLPVTTTLAKYDILGELERWLVSTTDVERAVPKDLPRTNEARMLRVAREQPGDRIVVSREGSYDPARFNEVWVDVVSGGRGTLGATLLRDGEPVAYTTNHPVPVGRYPTRVALLLPARHRGDEPYDTLSIRIDDALGRVFLRHIQLVDRPAAARLPDPAAGSTLVALAGEGRQGVGLTPGRPLLAHAVVPEGGVLSFSYAHAPLAEVTAPEIEVTVRSAQGAVIGERFRLQGREGAPGWQTGRLSLGGWAGERVTARFELLSAAEGSVAAIIADAAIWSAGSGPPSVLLVTSDTHRADHVTGARRAALVSTPALSALAQRGVFFEDCWAATNVTNPSHMALLTGAHPRDIGIHGNTQALGSDVPTLARQFADAGYVTRAVLSAQHLGDPQSGLGQGFDRMAWPELPGIRTAEETVELALDWLDEVGDRPLFLWVHLFDAHTPYRPPAEFLSPYYSRGNDPFDQGLPELGIDLGVLGPRYEGLRDLDYAKANYKGEVSYLDDQLGRLLEAPRFEQGIVAVTADHGESLGQHGIHFTHAGLYPDSLHVPLLLAWPGGPRGVRASGAVSQLDLGVTLLELAGAPADGQPGRSLVDQLDLAVHDGPPRFALASHRFGASVTWRGLHLMLHLKSQQHRYMTSTFEQHQVQLYDLAADPECEIDLVDARPEQAAELRGRLIDWLDDAQPLGWSGVVDGSAETLQRLEALGYVEGEAAGGEALWVPDACAWCQRFDG